MLEKDWVADVFPTEDLAQLGGPLPVGSRRRAVATGVAGRALDLALSARATAAREAAALDAAAAAAEPTEVTVLAVYGRDPADLVAGAKQLASNRHDVRVRFGAIGSADPRLAAATALEGLSAGKFANLNRLLEGEMPTAGWVLITDDDVVLPPRFLDRAIGVAERLGFDLCQPAQTWRSDAAWRITRRRSGIARETRFVEIGPVCLMRASVLTELTPFYEDGMGWGLCLHWAAVARDRGWRLGIIDALAVRHESRGVASGYDKGEALAAARTFLESHEHVNRDTANEVLATHRRLPSAGAATQ